MPPTTRPTNRTAGVRQTQSGHDVYAKGGAGTIARRGVDPILMADLGTARGVGRVMGANALRLLKLLPDLHPTFDYARHQLLTLACASPDIAVFAVREGDQGEVEDEGGTRALRDLWSSLPKETNGVHGLIRMLLWEAEAAGMNFVEAVPGRRGQGVAQVWPVDSLSIEFRRDGDGFLVPQQRQVGGSRNGMVDLSTETCFWSARDPEVDNPYGRSRFGSALGEAISDIAMLKDVRDAIHMSGSARYVQTFPFQETFDYAIAPIVAKTDGGKTGLGLSYEDAMAFVAREFQAARDHLGDLLSDDALLVTSGSDVKVLDGAKGATGLEKIAVFLRQRITQGTKTPGTLLGISDGSTDTFSTKELEVYVASLETDREVAFNPVKAVGDLHLRLLGLDCRVKITARPIRATDAIVLANTEAANIANVERKVANGWISPDDGSKEITGSLPFDPERAKNVGTVTAVARAAAPVPPAPAKAAVSFRRDGKPPKAKDPAEGDA